ncbi:MAG: tetratricopeptide repeat protein, partial [Bryobacteraceae bacterium]
RGGSSMGSSGGSGGRGPSERDLMGCEIRAVLPGFRSESVPLSGRRTMDNPDVGTIVLRRLANVEGTTISAIAMKAPKDAKKAIEKAHNLLKKNKADEAMKEYEKAVGIYPQYSTAFYEMGRIHESKNRAEEARKCYLQAIEIDSKYVNPYRQLAGMYVREQKWREAAEFSQKAIKLDPVDFADSYFYNSVANYFLKNYDDAQSSAAEAKKLDARNRIPKVHQLLGAINIERQDYAAAATHMKDYLKFLPAGQEADQMQKQIDELEKAVAARSGNR